MSSYRDINYSLRPAKNIERKMLCDAFARLTFVKKINQYRYIGFGSPYFSDFYLLHRRLGIKNLISIEKDKHNEERFLFNKPFSCIKMEFDASHNVLPKLDWEKIPTILWLDYDGKLDKDKISDVNTFFTNAMAGSVFVLSINAQPDIFPEMTVKKDRHTELAKRVGDGKLPPNIGDFSLATSDNYKALREIVNMEIDETLQIRNGGVKEANQIAYKQLFYFTYRDNALMLTIGGLLYLKSQEHLVDSLELDNLEFVKSGDEAFSIDVPCLTYKEIHALDGLLPDKIVKNGKIKFDGHEKIKPPKLVDADVHNYSRIYKYFPNFAEANF